MNTVKPLPASITGALEDFALDHFVDMAEAELAKWAPVERKRVAHGRSQVGARLFLAERGCKLTLGRALCDQAGLVAGITLSFGTMPKTRKS